ncbi:MAG: STAS domain-containing protein, partial [Verrucomicrobiota bacterium]|nr:STAS domain-containing protein [Verrucomicrobiota bacterium]
FVIDFRQCTGMDSTFLGVLAGAALELRRRMPPGSLVLTRIGQRNLELIRNLGLHRLLTVDAGDFPMSFDSAGAPLDCADHGELENARLVLEAHENLIAANENNRGKFQDVLAFLKNRLEHP